MIFDLHVHTDISDCSVLTLEDILNNAGLQGLDGVCITDHGSMDVRNRLQEGVQPNGLCVLFGSEYETPDGDFLVFGPFEELEPGLPAARLLATVVQQGGAAVAAHPFRGERPVSQWLVEEGLCRIVETVNGRNTPEENLKVRHWRTKYRFAECGGSDAHSLGELGRAATRFSVPVRTRPELVRALSTGLCRPVTIQPQCLSAG